MKRFFVAAASLSLLALSISAVAAPWQDRDHDQDHGWSDDGHGRGHGRGHDDDDRGHGRGHDDDRRGYGRDDDRHDNGRHLGWDKHYGRGDRLPERYRVREYYVDDYYRYHLHEPRPGYRWVRGDGGQFVLIAITTGIITDIVLGN